MAQAGSIIGQITEELGELSKQAVEETLKVPKEIAGKAMESLGSATVPKTVPDEFTNAPDHKTKRVMARAALEHLAGRKKEPKESSVWEREQQEQEQKRKEADAKSVAAAKQKLPETGSKRPPGDLYGVRTKRGAAEMSRNVRSD